MPKKQTRFSSEAAILNAIDATERRRVCALVSAEELEMHMERQPPGEHKDYIRKQARVAARSAERLAGKKVELGKALAAFRTKLLPMGLEDDSVVL